MIRRLVAASTVALLALGTTACQGEGAPPGGTVAAPTGTAPAGTPVTAPPPATLAPAPPAVTRTYPGGGPMRPNPYCRVGPMAVSPDGALVAAGCPAGVCVWDVATGQRTRTLPGKAALAWSPDGATLAVGDGGMTVLLVDAVSGATRHVLAGHEKPVIMDYIPQVAAAAFSPDGSRLATVGDEGAVLLWDPGTGRGADRLPFRYPTTGVRGLAWSPDGSRLAVAGDGGARVWKPGSGEMTVVPRPVNVFAVAWSADGTRVVMGGRQDHGMSGAAEVLVLGAADLRPVAAHPVGSWSQVAISPDSRTVAFVDYRTREILLWAGDGSRARIIGGMGEREDQVRWARGGRVLLTASTNEGIAVWDAATGQRGRTLTP